MSTLIDVPGAGTPKRPIRVETDLWEAYKKACKAEGISCAEDVRRHIREKVAAHESELPPPGQQAEEEEPSEGEA